MKSFVITSVLLLTLVLASVTVAEAQARKVLQPTELCSDNPPTAIATFEDADLEAVVRTALSVSAREDLTCGLVSGLTRLTARPGGRNQVFVVYGAPRPPDRAIPEHPFESLVGIQNLTSLTNLTINDRSLTDISPLSGLTSLTSLQLHTNRIRDISPLRGLTGLTQLTISENLITDLSALSGLTNLEGLRLHAHTPPLHRYLAASDNAAVVAITDISALSGLTNLRELRLHINAITDISAVSGMTSLTSLRLYENSITDISALSGLTNLELLWLQENSITDISALSGMTNLTSLALNDNSITDLSPLSGLTSLEELFLGINSITDIGALSGLTSLEILRLNDNSITDISALSGLTSLTELALDNSRDLINVQPLMVNPGLGAGDEVDLRFTWVSCSDVAALEAKGVTILRVTSPGPPACQ